ncbi:recX family protein, partial [Vibrio parahaemolyticus V-223/04]
NTIIWMTCVTPKAKCVNMFTKVMVSVVFAKSLTRSALQNLSLNKQWQKSPKIGLNWQSWQQRRNLKE